MLRLFRSGIDFLKKAFLVVVIFGAIFAIFGSVISSNRPQYDEQKVLHTLQMQLYNTFSRDKLGIKKGSGKDLLLSLFRSMECSFTGELCQEEILGSDASFAKSYMGKVSGLITMTYTNPPASGSYWVGNVLQNAGFIPQSYAAEGMGFTMIKPLMNLWKIFRDVAYLIIVVFLTIVGFMIMFRTKINPQTVISVENSLPKVIVALLLITFSFAIAGFLIDLMYILIFLIIGILSNNNAYYDVGKMSDYFFRSNFGTLWDSSIPLPPAIKPLLGMANFGFVGNAVLAILPQQLNYALRSVAIGGGVIITGRLLLDFLDKIGVLKFANGWHFGGFSVGSWWQALLSFIYLSISVPILVNLISAGFGYIVGFIINLAIIGMVFQIFFILIKSYLQITMSIIFSPIILLFEALPGNNNFSFWVKGLLGELLTFPIIITLLLVEKIMFMTMTYPGDFWAPPFLVNLNPGTFSVIFGLGLFLIIPDIIKLVKESIGAKQMPLNIGLGTFFGGAGTVTGGAMGILQQFSTLSMGISGISNLTGIGRAKPGPLSKGDLMKAFGDLDEKDQAMLGRWIGGKPPEK